MILDDLLVCPKTKMQLVRSPIKDAEARLGGTLRSRDPLLNYGGAFSDPVGVTETVYTRTDGQIAYPCVDDIPILLAPEALAVSADPLKHDLTEPRYAEAYAEMDFYETEAVHKTEAALSHEAAATVQDRDSFPLPVDRWIDSPHDGLAQLDAYNNLLPIHDRRLLQVGGSGSSAMKFLLAGAAHACLVTPILGEAIYSRDLAAAVGVGARFGVVVGIAEELPFQAETFDGVYMGGSLHHMITDLAFCEASRVLRSDGRFSAVEPWRAPFYGLGTKALGKREDAFCSPLTEKRLAPIGTHFASYQIIHHGAFTRYALLGLEKLGIALPKNLLWRITGIDDKFASIVPAVRRSGSSVAVLARKA
jgi:uncharacterized protein YbaR (Trm112 family)/SAM-dependent methyltransferase